MRWRCRCCGRWRVSVELIRGRYWYRLAHAYRDEVGGVNVLGETTSVAALDRLLSTYARMTLADLVEDLEAGPGYEGSPPRVEPS
jgi:hypothetical protein